MAFTRFLYDGFRLETGHNLVSVSRLEGKQGFAQHHDLLHLFHQGLGALFLLHMGRRGDGGVFQHQVHPEVVSDQGSPDFPATRHADHHLVIEILVHVNDGTSFRSMGVFFLVIVVVIVVVILIAMVLVSTVLLVLVRVLLFLLHVLVPRCLAHSPDARYGDGSVERWPKKYQDAIMFTDRYSVVGRACTNCRLVPTGLGRKFEKNAIPFGVGRWRRVGYLCGK